MKRTKALCGILTIIIGIAVETIHAQIFVLANNNLMEYKMSGALVNSSLITGVGPSPLASDSSGEFFVFNNVTGYRISKYSASGAVLATSLIPSLNGVYVAGIVCDTNDHLFVLTINASQNGTIGEYTTSGAIVNASLISNLYNPSCMAYDGNGHLFVAGWGGPGVSPFIGEYTTSGMTVNASLVTGLQTPYALAADKDGFVYVASQSGGTIGKYSSAGQTINAALITNVFAGVYDLAIDGSGHLFVAQDGAGTIGEYTTSGVAVNPSLITGLNLPQGLLVIPPVPPQVGLLKAVKPSFSHLTLGTAYQLQVSADLNTWTNQGAAFAATNTSMVYPQYWDVDNWGQLFFRLQVAP
jgi:hypothetical protein